MRPKFDGRARGVRARALLTLVAGLALVAAACGDDDSTGDTAGPTTTSTAGDTSTTTAAPTTTAPAETTATEATTTTTAGGPGTPDADVVLEATVAGGSVTEGGGRQEIPLGSSVALVVTADVEDEIHLHGYDVSAHTVPGQPVTLTFTANIPGVFEVEMHEDGLALWDLEVS